MTTEEPRRLAVFSDIHGNLHALQATLAAIDAMNIETMVCCGDVVGYGAFPNECIELIQERRIPTLVGNHDHAAIGQTDIKFFNDIAKAAVYWTREHLREDNAQWLRQLPYTHALGDRFFFVHASPQEPERWGYVLTFGDARAGFDSFDQQICFIGHSHQPAVVVKQDEELSCPEDEQIAIAEDCRYLINVGSVGQPRDRNPDACFVTVDLDEGKIQYHRTAYDVEAAQNAIIQNGLPQELAIRLDFGW